MSSNLVLPRSSTSRSAIGAKRPSAAHLPLVALFAFGTPSCGSDSDTAGSGGTTSQAGAGGSRSGGGGTTAGGGVGGSGGMVTGGASSAGAPTGGLAAGGAGGSTTGGGSASAGASNAGAGGSGGASGGAGGQGGGGGAAGGSGGQGGGGGFTLTSSKLAPGAMFAAEYTCASSSEHSPPLTWTAGPSGTLSYAIVLQDTSINFNHWVVWDIPPSTTMLPESLPTDATLSMPAGAKQKAGQGMGYLGPCPSGMLHTYVFTVYALDVATLPGVMASSSTMSLSAAIQMHDLASASLSGMSDAQMP